MEKNTFTRCDPSPVGFQAHGEDHVQKIPGEVKMLRTTVGNARPIKNACRPRGNPERGVTAYQSRHITSYHVPGSGGEHGKGKIACCQTDLRGDFPLPPIDPTVTIAAIGHLQERHAVRMRKYEQALQGGRSHEIADARAGLKIFEWIFCEVAG